MLALIIEGIYRGYSGHELAPISAPIKVDPTSAKQLLRAPAGFAFFYLMLRGFAEGCAAMTGTEAISNGIPAFKPPESKNAAQTIVIMASILALMFLGLAFLTTLLVAVPCRTHSTSRHSGSS